MKSKWKEAVIVTVVLTACPVDHDLRKPSTYDDPLTELQHADAAIPQLHGGSPSGPV